MALVRLITYTNLRKLPHPTGPREANLKKSRGRSRLAYPPTVQALELLFLDRMTWKVAVDSQTDWKIGHKAIRW